MLLNLISSCSVTNMINISSSATGNCCCPAVRSPNATRASVHVRDASLLARRCLSHQKTVATGKSRRFSAAAAAPGSEDSLDTVLGSLRKAFGAPPAPQNDIQTVEVASGAASKAADSNSMGSRGRSSRGSRDSSSSSRGGQKPSRRVGLRHNEAVEVSSAAEDVTDTDGLFNRRKGRFGDLINALEYEQLYPDAETTTTSSSSTTNGNSIVADSSSSISRTTNTTIGSSGGRLPRQAQPPGAAPGRVRRIRVGGTDGQQQQQQQQQHQLLPPKQQQQQLERRQRQQQSKQPKQQAQKQPQQQQQQPPPWLLAQQAAAAAGGGGARRVKQYAPVPKGNLLLPGGPSWSSLRRHVVAAGSEPHLPTLDCIVIVEGDNDQRAVCRAVNAHVYVCDGTRVLKDHVRPELEMLQQLGRTLVVLTDPDERGRELRCHLDDMIGPLHHAFVPEEQGTSTRDGPVHEAGNRGIEHVVPVGVQLALSEAAPSWPKGRAVWSLEDLQTLQLCNAFDAGQGVAQGSGGAAARRRQLCALLGLGRCTAAQLLAVLNRFFSEERVAAALQQLDAEMPPRPAGEAAVSS